jgi:hypothetical protein
MSDASGYVGTFTNVAAVSEIRSTHSTIPFIVQKYPIAPENALDKVWIVLFSANDAVAFVSNSREEAVRIQRLYLNVGLAHEGDIGYWEQPIGLAISARERLNSITRAHVKYANMNLADTEAEALRAAEEDLERISRLNTPLANGPLQRMLRENEPTTSIADIMVIRPSPEPDEEPTCISAPAPEAGINAAEPAAPPGPAQNFLNFADSSGSPLYSN